MLGFSGTTSVQDSMIGHANIRTFPNVFPGEIRNRIYQYILSSESGSITFSKVQHRIRPARYRIYPCDIDGAEEIRLSFLRTCKVIYEECKDLLWTLNTLDLEALRYPGPGQLDSNFIYFDVSLLSKLRSVALDIDITIDGFEVGALRQVLDELDLVAMVKRNALESVTIHLRNKFGSNPLIFPHRSLGALLRMGELQDPDNEGLTMLDTLLEILGSAFKGYSIKRHMCIELGAPVWDSTHGFPKRAVPASSGDPNALLQKINKAWGGDLEIDNVVCYKDGKCLIEMWCKGAYGKNQETFALRKDVDLWLAAKDYNMRRNGPNEGNLYQTLTLMGESKEFQDEVMQKYEDPRAKLLKNMETEAISHDSKAIPFPKTT